MDYADLERRFQYHAPTEEAKERTFPQLRQHALELAFHILEVCPDSREASLAVTKLEEAVYWAIASIAREGN